MHPSSFSFFIIRQKASAGIEYFSFKNKANWRIFERGCFCKYLSASSITRALKNVSFTSPFLSVFILQNLKYSLVNFSFFAMILYIIKYGSKITDPAITISNNPPNARYRSAVSELINITAETPKTHPDITLIAPEIIRSLVVNFDFLVIAIVFTPLITKLVKNHIKPLICNTGAKHDNTPPENINQHDSIPVIYFIDSEREKDSTNKHPKNTQRESEK